MKYEIVSIDKLKPLEKVFPTHLKNLEAMIDSDGFLLKAIIADVKTGTVLDGSHRYAYLLKKGFKEAPVYWADYDDENIRVGTHLSHRFLIDGSSGITKHACRQRALSGLLFTPRTTRHFFTFRKTDISLPLSSLKIGEPVDISHLVADVGVVDEIQHNEHYIAEIDEEVETIVRYLSEVMETKKYLLDQIDSMNESKLVALFPGKFHPPHIGHIQTILGLLPRYKRLIVGVSEHQPEQAILTPDEIQKTLVSFFEDYEDVNVCRISGVLVEKETLDGLPKFDVMLSGNEDVLEWAKKHGLEARRVPRSVGYLYSGTEIRTAFTKEGD
jgi:nicotinamide mononucleotide adenylyltransferase